MKTIIKNIKENYKLVIGVLIVGILLGWLIFPSSGNSEMSESTVIHEGHEHESEDPTTWTCSMHPQIKQDKPGDCPICGMDLIPLTSLELEGNNFDPNEVMMTTSAVKLAEIQTTKVLKGNPEKEIYLQGKVEYDERKMAELTARFGGRIEKLYISFTGEKVNKGEKLASIYSPELVTAQREILEAISLKQTRPAIYEAAKAKLKLWDLTDKQIAEIEEQGEVKSYFDILSPISGTVMKRYISLGGYVKTGDPLFMVTDLSTVWVMFDAYEDDLPWIKEGDKIEFTFQSVPGKQFEANVSFIDPFINPKTRTAKVRIGIKNSNQELKPEMFASGKLYSKIAESTNQLIIPKSSVLWTGKRAVVYVKVPERENPTFIYREIILGPQVGDSYVVESGLVEGEEIASNGVFKIDASAQLEGKMSMMNPEGGNVSTGHNHGDIKMENTSEIESHENMEIDKTEISTPDDFKQQLTKVYNAYLEMKDAFIESDKNKVSSKADVVSKNLKNVNMELLKGNAHMEWMKYLEELDNTLNLIQKSSDIDKQRIEFSQFNLTFYKVLKDFGLKNTTVYYQYCPMANGDKGAYWFSSNKEIRNPYFGDMMMSCGETRETIK